MQQNQSTFLLSALPFQKKHVNFMMYFLYVHKCDTD